eukprot:10060745-Alexandrium_andersonii.AAC.1
MPAHSEFYCDNSKHLQSFVQANYPSKVHYADILSRDEAQAPEVDIFLTTPPCQPFAPGGLQQGLQDARGKLVFASCAYILEKRPAIALLESSNGLRSPKNAKIIQALCLWMKATAEYKCVK